jgi:hypothetical protein
VKKITSPWRSHTQRLEFFENIFCKRLRSSKVWLLLLSSTPTRGTIPFCLNFISHAPLIFCTTRPCCLTAQLDALQGFEQNILKHHERFTDKILNHIVYIDKEIWGSPDDTLKQKILNDAKKNNNKVLVVYDSATGEKNST